MKVRVRLFSVFRPCFDNQAEVSVDFEGTDNTTVRDVLGRLITLAMEPDKFKARLFRKEGEDEFALNRNISIYRNSADDIRLGDGLGTILNDDDELSLLPAIAGG